jgi:hypothetical protein
VAGLLGAGLQEIAEFILSAEETLEGNHGDYLVDSRIAMQRLRRRVRRQEFFSTIWVTMIPASRQRSMTFSSNS